MPGAFEILHIAVDCVAANRTAVAELFCVAGVAAGGALDRGEESSAMMADAVVLLYLGIAVLAEEFGFFVHRNQEPDPEQVAQQEEPEQADEGEAAGSFFALF